MTPVSGAVRTPRELGTKRVRLVFVGLMITELLASLDSTIFTTALPTVVGQLHGVDDQLWVLTAYLLTSTISLPVYGKVGDLIGRKPPVPGRDRALRGRFGDQRIRR